MAGVAVGAAFLTGAGVGAWGLLVVTLAVALGLLLVDAPKRLVLPALVVLAAAGLGLWRGGGSGLLRPVSATLSPAWVDAAAGVQGTVVTAPAATGLRQNFDLAVSAVRLGTIAEGRFWEPADGRVCVSAPAFPTIRFGDTVRLSGEPRPLSDVAPDIRAALHGRGCAATLFAPWAGLEEAGPAGLGRGSAAARAALTRVLREAAPGDAGALLAGLVTGDDHALSRSRRAAFLRSGTTHITAVSGANVALVVGVATALGRVGGWRRRLAWQSPTLTAIWGYALMTGLGSPVSRAALVASGAVLAVRVGRRADLLTLTVLAAAAMVAVEPAQITRPSFQLSFAASLGLVAVFAGTMPEGVRGWGAALLKASIAAQVATLPIVLGAFGSLSLVALPANLLIAPMVTLGFPLAVVAGAVATLVPPFGAAAVAPAHLCAAAIFAVVDRFGASRSAVWLSGDLSPVATLLLALVVGMLLTCLSGEGRSWVRRCRLDWVEAGPYRRRSTIAAGGGAVLGLVVVGLAR